MQVLARVLLISGIQCYDVAMDLILAKIDLIKHAVASRQSLTFTYKEHTRVVSPHLLGQTADGKFVCHAFQFSGFGSKGQLTPETGAWRYFYLDEIQDFGTSEFLPWYPETLQKSEGEYKPPAFITNVLVIVG